MYELLVNSNVGTSSFEPFSEETPYEQWMGKEGVPVHTGCYYIPDVRKIELKPWERMGARSALIDLAGSEGTDGAYIIEIAPGASTHEQRFLFEEALFVLDGEGETEVWNPSGKRRSFRWHKGSMFSPPLNVWRRHFNRGSQPARLISFHDLPLLMDVFHNPDFLFRNDLVFSDRYIAEGERGSGLMAESGMQTHISEFAAGSYECAPPRARFADSHSWRDGIHATVD